MNLFSLKKWAITLIVVQVAGLTIAHLQTQAILKRIDELKKAIMEQLT